MNDLIEHLDRGNVIRLYKGKYNNVTRTLYILIRSAIRDGSTYIAIQEQKITWGEQGNQMGEFSLEKIPDGEKIHIDNMLLILEKDKIVRNYITSYVQNDRFICSISYV